VNWAFHLAPDGVSDLRRLVPELQEQVLDEMERFASAITGSSRGDPDSSVTHAFATQVGNDVVTVTLTLRVNWRAARIALLGVELT
jgi:hypothetical protein